MDSSRHWRMKALGAVAASLSVACLPHYAHPDGGPGVAVEASGCGEGPPAPVSAAGYYVNGNTVCTAAGRPHLFHGVDRPSLEWDPAGEHLSLADFEKMAAWKANVVRIALNQDFWLAGSSVHDANYASQVAAAVDWAEQAGLDVILDLHWSDRGILGSCVANESQGCQQLMADRNSLTFWTEVASLYKDDGRVLFELYNEPHDVGWPIWLEGGTTNEGWQTPGMQKLYEAVRATGANNLVIAGGLSWAYDLSGVAAYPIRGFNVLYATHPYNNSLERSIYNWDASWGFLASTRPVIVTEFGDLSSACDGQLGSSVIAYADLHRASWTAWAWFPSGCSFPSLIEDWDGTATAQGKPVRAALLGYDDPPAASDPTVDAGSSEGLDDAAVGSDPEAGP